LVAVFIFGWPKKTLFNSFVSYLTALFLTFTYGLSDELHQSFINGREGKLLDACVDGLGGTLAMVIIKKNKLLEQIISL